MAPFVTREQFAELLTQGLSSREIAKRRGMSQSNVRHWLNKYGLQLPHRRGPVPRERRCLICGATDRAHFYGRHVRRCIRCDNTYTIRRGRETRRRTRELLGGKCHACGYDTHEAALDVHHVDPALKDPNFAQMRGWAWARVEEELAGCILLCKNCHAATHAGLLDLDGSSSREMAPNTATAGPHGRDRPKTDGQKPQPELSVATRRCRCGTCGETDPALFYKNKTNLCAQCGKDYNLRRARATAKKARDYFGGACKACGYDRHDVALDIHHLDPAKKDPSFKRMRSWSWRRVEAELQGCILLCKNCLLRSMRNN